VNAKVRREIYGYADVNNSRMLVQSAPIKNNRLQILYFNNGSTDLSQTFIFYMWVFIQHILQISYG